MILAALLPHDAMAKQMVVLSCCKCLCSSTPFKFVLSVCAMFTSIIVEYFYNIKFDLTVAHN